MTEREAEQEAVDRVVVTIKMSQRLVQQILVVAVVVEPKAQQHKQVVQVSF